MFEVLSEQWETLSEIGRLVAAVGGGVTALATLYAAARVVLPRAFRRGPDSPALAAFLAALESDEAIYDPRTRQLTCPGLEATFDESVPPDVVSAIVPTGALAPTLPGGKDGREYRRACRAALARRAEVQERDRRQDNDAAACAMARAKRPAAPQASAAPAPAELEATVRRLLEAALNSAPKGR